MNKIIKKPIAKMGWDFIAPEHLQDGQDEFTIRNTQRPAGRSHRALKGSEIEILVKNENTADEWTNVRVTDRFNPNLVKRCQFHGLVRIGDLEDYYLEYHDLRLPVGLYDCVIISSDIGSHVAFQNVRYLAHYIIGNDVILSNIDEMLTSDYAKFGNGIIKVGEPEAVRIRIELANENGGRSVLPFDGMLSGDAWIWSKFRDDPALMDRLREITDASFDRRRGYYGIVGDRTIIKDCRILKDVKVGTDAYIKGANKLKNLTVNSSAEAQSQIGEGVEMVNGIIGYGSRVFYGVKAVRFILGSNSALKYGARLINSYLGDNSTISCCEVLNSLIFPGHEQHHNNSFLCAATVLGQSNLAAGATIGSNHNSRSSDGEIIAGRGFWPALCTSLKHNSRFASFTLLAKGDYPAELRIPVPFSLVSDNQTDGVLQIMPGYWFHYNMYALARNTGKYVLRDNRIDPVQRLDFEYLAPDTVEEIFDGMELLALWAGAFSEEASLEDLTSPDDIRRTRERGRSELVSGTFPETVTFCIPGIESTRRPIRILKAARAYTNFRDMVVYYGVRTLVDFMEREGIADIDDIDGSIASAGRTGWVNLGGQLVPREKLETLKRDIKDGVLATWTGIHERYRVLGGEYDRDRAKHAYGCLAEILSLRPGPLDRDRWNRCVTDAIATRKSLAERTVRSRAKDYDNYFRTITYDSPEEMTAVAGTLDDNEFIRDDRLAAERFEAAARRFIRE